MCCGVQKFKRGERFRKEMDFFFIESHPGKGGGQSFFQRRARILYTNRMFLFKKKKKIIRCFNDRAYVLQVKIICKSFVHFHYAVYAFIQRPFVVVVMTIR